MKYKIALSNAESRLLKVNLEQFPININSKGQKTASVIEKNYKIEQTGLSSTSLKAGWVVLQIRKL